MKEVTFGQARLAMGYGAQKINLHELGKEPEPKAFNATPGSGDLCFVTETPLSEAVAYVKNKGVEIIEGPVERTGANGPICSFYFRDPDQNLIEIANEI